MNFPSRLLERLQRPLTLDSLENNHELGSVLRKVYKKLKTGNLTPEEKASVAELTALYKRLETDEREFGFNPTLPNERIKISSFFKENAPSDVLIQFYYLLALHLPATAAMEMNAGTGISGAALLKGMSDSGASDYTLISFEENKELCMISEQIFNEVSTSDHFQIIRGKFDYSIDRLIGLNLKFDLVYLECGNRYQPIVDYFNYLSSFHSSRSVFILDKIRKSKESYKAWKHILTLRSSYAVDFFDFGLIIFEEGDKSKKRYRLSLK